MSDGKAVDRNLKNLQLSTCASVVRKASVIMLSPIITIPMNENEASPTELRMTPKLIISTDTTKTNDGVFKPMKKLSTITQMMVTPFSI